MNTPYDAHLQVGLFSPMWSDISIANLRYQKTKGLRYPCKIDLALVNQSSITVYRLLKGFLQTPLLISQPMGIWDIYIQRKLELVSLMAQFVFQGKS